MSALRLLTWNLNGLDPTDLDVRTEAACLAMLLRPRPPDVVLLQEVVGRTWHAHVKHHFAAAGFVAVPGDPVGTTESEYFSVLFVRKQLTVLRGGTEPFPNSGMGRRLVWAEIDWAAGLDVRPEGARPLLVATSHLESGKEATMVRAAQLAAVIEGLRTHDGPAVFGGDTNLRVSEEKVIPGLADVHDAWALAGSPTHQRATWPAVPRDRRPGARFDRVLVSGAAVQAFVLSGHSAPGFPAAPSDHLAIEVELDLAG